MTSAAHPTTGGTAMLTILHPRDTAAHARAEAEAEAWEAENMLDPERFIPESLVSVNPEFDEISEIDAENEMAEMANAAFREDFLGIDLDPWGPNWN